MDLNYDESSQEVVTTIAMIKSMTTTARRRSSLAKSPMLPRINNCKRGSRSKNVPDPKSSAASLGDSSKSSSVNSWPTRGVTLASIEFKRRLEKRRSKPQVYEVQLDKTNRARIAEHAEKQSQRMTVLKSIFQATDEKKEMISPLRPSNPSKSFPTSRKIDYRKKSQPKGEAKTTKVPQTELPLLSVMKITPERRPTFHQGTKASLNAK